MSSAKRPWVINSIGCRKKIQAVLPHFANYPLQSGYLQMPSAGCSMLWQSISEMLLNTEVIKAGNPIQTQQQVCALSTLQSASCCSQSTINQGFSLLAERPKGWRPTNLYFLWEQSKKVPLSFWTNAIRSCGISSVWEQVTRQYCLFKCRLKKKAPHQMQEPKSLLHPSEYVKSHPFSGLWPH